MEGIDTGTGLPYGLQPTPVGTYDFSQAFQSIQGMLDKIAMGQANRMAQKKKDKKLFEETYNVTKPLVWRQDDAYVQEAMDAYDKLLFDTTTTHGYDEEKWPDGTKKQINAAEYEVNRRAAESKANQKWYEDKLEEVRVDDGKTFDTGWGDRVLNNFFNATSTEERNAMRLSTEDDYNPTVRSYTIHDVIKKYNPGLDVDQYGNADVNVKKLETNIYQGIQAGIGERMYELNRLDSSETKEQFAKRVAEMGPEMIRETDARLRKESAEKVDYGFNEMGVRPVFYKKSEGPAAAYADQSVPKNSVHYVKKGGTNITVNIGEGALQQQVSMAYITKAANNKYYLFGTRTGALSPLSDPIELTQDDIQTIDAQFGVDVIGDINRAINDEKWANSKIK
jgi:hypothetical protein